MAKATFQILKEFKVGYEKFFVKRKTKGKRKYLYREAGILYTGPWYFDSDNYSTFDTVTEAESALDEYLIISKKPETVKTFTREI